MQQHSTDAWRSSLARAARKHRPTTARRVTEADSSAYWLGEPTERQRAFLELDCEEALYGGAAGGGKTWALLRTALEYVHVPGYSAILLRKSYPDLFQEGQLVDMSHDWLGHTAATWNGEHHRWTFPSGARLVFGYLKHNRDLDRYQGGRYHFVGFDELTQHRERHYRYLFSRMRRLRAGDVSDVPIRMRATANPGGIGHEWVKSRFIDHGAEHGRVFVPARLEDNPHLDVEDYSKRLEMLSPLDQERLRWGNWDARPEGGMFKREWFRFVDPDEVPGDLSIVRFWDCAATTEEEGSDPDYTVGAKVGLSKDGQWYVLDIKRKRVGPADVESLIRSTAQEDGPAVKVRMEQEPGSSGKTVISHYARRVLAGYAFEGVRSTGDKETRAAPVASAAKAGNVILVRAPWNGEFLDEHEAFPQVSHDDQVDAVSGAVGELRVWKPGGITETQQHRRKPAENLFGGGHHRGLF